MQSLCKLFNHSYYKLVLRGLFASLIDFVQIENKMSVRLSAEDVLMRLSDCDTDEITEEDRRVSRISLRGVLMCKVCNSRAKRVKIFDNTHFQMANSRYSIDRNQSSGY